MNSLIGLARLERIAERHGYNKDIDKEAIESVETSLKALEIIKKKRVDVDVLLNCKTLEDFNGAMGYTHNCKDFNLTQEEFDLLKKELEK